jgi:hypothetical protein
MRFRNLSENGDWQFGRGKQCYKEDVSAIALNIKTRLKCWVGDCFFDYPMGIDYQNIIGRFNVRELLEKEINRVILATAGVLSVISSSVSLVGRGFIATYSVNTVLNQSLYDNFAIDMERI